MSELFPRGLEWWLYEVVKLEIVVSNAIFARYNAVRLRERYTRAHRQLPSSPSQQFNSIRSSSTVQHHSYVNMFIRCGYSGGGGRKEEDDDVGIAACRLTDTAQSPAAAQ